MYVQELRRHNVKDVVRVCEPSYSTNRLGQEGITVVVTISSMPLPLLRKVCFKVCVFVLSLQCGWFGSRVVSVLDSGAEWLGFKSQPLRCRVTQS